MSILLLLPRAAGPVHVLEVDRCGAGHLRHSFSRHGVRFTKLPPQSLHHNERYPRHHGRSPHLYRKYPVSERKYPTFLNIRSNFRGGKCPEYLLVWEALTSLRPLLFLAQLLNEAVHARPSLAAELMAREGLPFIITIYCMHLMLDYYRQLGHGKTKSPALLTSIKVKSYSTV